MQSTALISSTSIPAMPSLPLAISNSLHCSPLPGSSGAHDFQSQHPGDSSIEARPRTGAERLIPRPEARPTVPQTILMVTAIAGAESCASSLAATLGVPVEIAASRKLGLAALRRRDYATVIVDDSIAEADPVGADLLWKHSGLAVPLQINFALLGCARLGREVKAALARREQEQSLAMRAAASTLENDLKSTVTGLLLHSELALSEPAVPPQLADKLRLMVELAGSLRRRLEQSHL